MNQLIHWLGTYLQVVKQKAFLSYSKLTKIDLV